jgi:hypothetical protein
MGISVVTGVIFLAYRRKSSPDELRQNDTTELVSSPDQASTEIISRLPPLSKQDAQNQEVNPTDILPMGAPEKTLSISSDTPPEIPQVNPTVQEVNQVAPIS